MRVLRVVEVQISADPGAGFRDAGIGPQVNLLVFDGAPEALDEDVVPPGALAIHADLDLSSGQHFDELGRSELAALIGVEYLRRAVTRQRFLHSFYAKIGLQRAACRSDASASDRHPTPGEACSRHCPG